MRKLTFCVMTVIMSLTLLSGQLNAGTELAPVSTNTTKPATSTTATLLLNRLDEINAMDKHNLSNSEKREMRKEVKSIQKQLKEMHGGVYLSVGAIIIIILLLILLL